MKKMQENHKKAMKNGGFSLVELIIVVAILAVLTALLAPQYFQYIERSRKAVDVNTASEILQATKIAAIDPDNKVAAGFTVTWTVAGTTPATAIASSNTNVQTALINVLADISAAKSAFVNDATDGVKNLTITAVYDASDGFTFTANTGWSTVLGIGTT